MHHQHPQLAMSVDEAARRADVCRDKIYAAVRDGHLEARKAGRRTLIMADDLQTYLKSLPRLRLPPS